ncbi:hypothetical protein [Pseudonocardia humida]|uniref:Uncharacterized protein n=1 Tax=Pseudonocardia humida TaxID=2800819 RepID=A0ABT0ZXJ4_9PSEU|nr:hypothetical protein [Pseudonocardia humida]MCO1655453.1 hypothetical protein [Pseudonocardia humida]
MFDRMRQKLGLLPTAEDVSADDHTARTRETGGADHDDADSATTTGTGTNEEFVGRVAGQTEGDAGWSGAEARAEGTAERNP